VTALSRRGRKVNLVKLRLSSGVHVLWVTMARMSNLLFLRRSYAYRHAAATAFRNARALPIGSEERNAERVFGRGLSELARAQAWLEGQRSHGHQFLRTLALPAWKPDRSDSGDGRAS
jgi:hypothetical protein